MDWRVRILIRWHTMTALNLDTLPCLKVKELFIYWYNFVAENLESLRSLTGVKIWTQWHALAAAKWTFFYFAVKLYPLLYLECSEERLIWIFLLLWNLKTGMLLLPEVENQYLLNAAKLDQLEYFEGCETRVNSITRRLWRLTHSCNSIPIKRGESNLEITNLYSKRSICLHILFVNIFWSLCCVFLTCICLRRRLFRVTLEISRTAP
jgi:hypothetical protein